MTTLTATKQITDASKVDHIVEVFTWGLYHKIITFRTVNSPYDRCKVTHTKRYLKNAQTKEEKEKIIAQLERKYKIKFNRN